MSLIAESTSDLLPELCERFQQSTGWRLRFQAADDSFERDYGGLERNPACCWNASISDGQRPAGLLWLERPDDEHDGTGFVEATRMAETVARLLGRLATAVTQLTLRNKDVATLLNLGLAMPAQDDLAFGLSQLLKAATHLTNSRSAAFFLLDSTTSRLKLRAVYQLGRTDVAWAERDLAASIPDLQALSDAPVALRADRPGALPLLPTMMQVALVAGVQSEQAPFGTLWVFDRRDRAYSQRDRHVLQSLAAQVAVVLERSALMHGSERHERLFRDIEAASHSQCDVDLRTLPADSRFELAARCTSCYELGGDLCEVLQLSRSRIGMAVGDASGKSIPAAMIMSAVRGAIWAQPAGIDDCDVARPIAEINRALCHITHAQQFMSLCYGIFDPERRQLTYCNAGHPAPLLIRDGRARTLDSHGLLLGVLPEAEYEYSSQQLDHGDLVVLYSDGISEARGEGPGLFSSRGIVAAVNRAGHATAQEVLDAVWDAVEAHRHDSQVVDDRTLLVLRVL